MSESFLPGQEPDHEPFYRIENMVALIFLTLLFHKLCITRYNRVIWRRRATFELFLVMLGAVAVNTSGGHCPTHHYK